MKSRRKKETTAATPVVRKKVGRSGSVPAGADEDGVVDALVRLDVFEAPSSSAQV